MSDSEDESAKVPFGGHGGSTKPRQKRSLSPTSDDGELVVPAGDDSDSPPVQERPLIRQSIAFSSQFASNATHEINTYQSSAPVASGSKKKAAFLPGQEVQVAPKSKKSKPRRERPKATYAGNTGRFRLKDYKPTTEHVNTTVPGPTPTLNAFQTFIPERETANSPALTTQSLSSENGNGQRTTPSDMSDVGNTAAEPYSNSKLSLSELLTRPNSRAAVSAPAGTTSTPTNLLSNTSVSSSARNTPPGATPAVPSPLNSNLHMNVGGHKSSSYYRRDYDKQHDLNITESISHDKRTQSLPLPQHRTDREGHEDVYSPSPASPPSAHSTSLSSPRMMQSRHVPSLSPITTQFPSPPPSSSIHTAQSSSRASPLEFESNVQFRHNALPSPPLQARPQFRSPPSQHPPQFRPPQFDEHSSQSSHSHSPTNDVQSVPRSPQMDVDSRLEPRFPQEESFVESSQSGAGPSVLVHHRSGYQHSNYPPSEPRALNVKPEENRLVRRPVSYKTSRMVTLLITDFRSRTEDHQLAEIVIPLRPVDPDSTEGGFWASAHDIVEALQSSPSRIESPARAYTMRGKWKQFFLRVLDGRNEVSSSANLLITPERTLDIGVISIAPSELPSSAYGRLRSPVPEHAHPHRNNMNSRQHEGQYAIDPSRKRQHSPSQGGRERRPFSTNS